MLIVSTNIVICLLNKKRMDYVSSSSCLCHVKSYSVEFFSNFFLFIFISLSSGMRIDET